VHSTAKKSQCSSFRSISIQPRCRRGSYAFGFEYPRSLPAHAVGHQFAIFRLVPTQWDSRSCTSHTRSACGTEYHHHHCCCCCFVPTGSSVVVTLAASSRRFGIPARVRVATCSFGKITLLRYQGQERISWTAIRNVLDIARLWPIPHYCCRYGVAVGSHWQANPCTGS
jgi:hypothetical protein